MALSFVGLRPTEMIGLRREDVSPDAIHVQRSLWRGHISEGGKSTRSRRIVGIGPVMAAILAGHQHASTSINRFVFENHFGRPLHTSGHEKICRDVLRSTQEAHGYKWKTTYGARHGAVTEVNRHTCGNTQIAAELFGRTPEVEATHYVHQVSEDMRRGCIGS